MWGFRAEPAAVAEFVRLVVIALVGFGVIHWTVEQQAMMLAVVSALLTFFVRQVVTSPQTLHDAGTSKEEVKAVADNPAATLVVSQAPQGVRSDVDTNGSWPRGKG